MSYELTHPVAGEFSIWRAKQFTLESKEVDTLIEAIKPGEAARVFDAVSSGRVADTGMLPQLMVLAIKSTIVWHPGLVARGRTEFDPRVISQRQLFIEELNSMKSQLHTSGIADLNFIPEDEIRARLLALGVFVEQALHQISEEKDDGIARSAPGFGKGNARLYGSRLERVTERLALNEQAITDTETVLDAAVFLMQINGEPSKYERTRNNNVARLMIESLNGGNFAYEDLRQTNLGIMAGLGHGGLPRDFEHWGGTSKNPPTPADIPSRLAVWQADVVSLLNASHNNPEMEIARLAADYNEIHPWREGNGRSLTVEANKLRFRMGLDPIYIPQDQNTDYIVALGNPISQKDSQKLANFYRAHAMPRDEFVQSMQAIVNS